MLEIIFLLLAISGWIKLFFDEDERFGDGRIYLVGVIISLGIAHFYGMQNHANPFDSLWILQSLFLFSMIIVVGFLLGAPSTKNPRYSSSKSMLIQERYNIYRTMIEWPLTIALFAFVILSFYFIITTW